MLIIHAGYKLCLTFVLSADIFYSLYSVHNTTVFMFLCYQIKKCATLTKNMHFLLAGLDIGCIL